MYLQVFENYSFFAIIVLFIAGQSYNMRVNKDNSMPYPLFILSIVAFMFGVIAFYFRLTEIQLVDYSRNSVFMAIPPIAVVSGAFYFLSIQPVKHFFLRNENKAINYLLYIKEFNGGFSFCAIGFFALMSIIMISSANMIGLLISAFFLWAAIKNLKDDLDERISSFSFTEEALIITTTRNNNTSVLPYNTLYFLRGSNLEQAKNIKISYDRKALIWPEISCHLHISTILQDIYDKKIKANNNIEKECLLLK